MGFTAIDCGILFTYLIGVTIFGSWLGKKQKNIKDYFLSGRNLPWTAVCFSLVARKPAHSHSSASPARCISLIYTFYNSTSIISFVIELL